MWSSESEAIGGAIIDAIRTSHADAVALYTELADGDLLVEWAVGKARADFYIGADAEVELVIVKEGGGRFPLMYVNDMYPGSCDVDGIVRMAGEMLYAE